MENVLTYILQVNILLSIIYLGYVFLLKGLTFYQLNRIYFIVGAIYALIYPFLDVQAWLKEEVSMPVIDLWGYIPYEVVERQAVSVFTLENMLLGVIGIGVVLLFFKFVFQIASLLRIHYFSNPALWKDYLYRNVVFPIVPFSFFNKIYIHKKQHQELELHDIFKHEDVHVKGLHTLDILLFEMVLIGSWYNPFVWLMRKAVRQNLEFLTDQQVLNKGVDRQTYQYSLLHVSKQGAAVGISNQFNFKTLKKRIMMMNKKRSSKLELSKYAFLLPIVIFTAGAFTVDKAEAKIEEVVQTAKQTGLQVVFKPDSVLSVKMNGEVGAILKEALGSDTIDIKIEGKVAGVKISADSIVKGMPEKALIIIDDVQSDRKNLNRIGADRISGSLVLSAADATARYGEKGKNGAVLVATKKEKSGILFQEHSPDIKTRADIDRTKTYLYLYDNKPVSKSAFFALPDAEVNSLRLIGKQSASIMYTNVFPDIKNMDGVIRAVSAEQKKIDNERFKNALVVVDGDVKEKGTFEMNSINADDIESISILKDGSATSLYGEKAKDGAILITTKARKVLKGKVEGIRIDSVATDSTSSEGVLRIRGRGNNDVEPLYLVNGKEKPSNVLSKLNPDDIESMEVWKEKSALEKYGEKGKDGVIEITLKKGMEEKYRLLDSGPVLGN